MQEVLSQILINIIFNKIINVNNLIKNYFIRLLLHLRLFHQHLNIL